MATATKSLLASLLLTLTGMASASGLHIAGLSGPLTISGYDPAPAITANYTSGYFGKVMASSPGTVTATYLGQESGYVNSYSLDFFNNMLLESNTPGTAVSALITGAAPILLDFSFNTKKNSNYIPKVENGGEFSVTSPSFAILGNYLVSQTATIAGQAHTFDYILGFNDSWTGDADFDDFVVGINFKPSVVPLPAAAWLFGSALFGFMMVSNRRKV